MKSENIFKFIAIRPPKRKGQDESNVIDFDDTSFEVVVQQKMKSGMTRAAAIKGAAGDFKNSGNYLFQISEMQPLFAMESRIRGWLKTEILKAKNSSISLTYNLMSVAALHSSMEGFDLNLFVQSDKYETIKTQLWNSLYCSYILNEPDNFDRDRIFFWVRVFHLFDALKVEDSDFFSMRLLQFNKTLPGIPRDYLPNNQEAQAEKPKALKANAPKTNTEEERDKKVKEIQNYISYLDEGIQGLQEIYQGKTKTLRERSSKSEKTGAYSIAVDKNQADPAPWIISYSDLEGNDKLLRILYECEIEQDNNDKSVFELIRLIEQVISKKISLLEDLLYVEETKVVQGILVKTLRKFPLNKK